MREIKPRKTLFNPELRRRGIYVLPNLFTTAALFCGFFAIVQAMQLKFDVAAIEFAERFGRSAPTWFSIPEMLGVQNANESIRTTPSRAGRSRFLP